MRGKSDIKPEDLSSDLTFYPLVTGPVHSCAISSARRAYSPAVISTHWTYRAHCPLCSTRYSFSPESSKAAILAKCHDLFKAQSHIPSRTSSAQKWILGSALWFAGRALWFAGRASEYVDDLTRTSFIVCVYLCAHFLHVQKCFSMRVNVDARRTSDQRQSNARHK